MTSFVDARGVAIRLGPEDRAAFIERFGAGLHEAHGATMKEFVTVPDDVLEDLPTVADWLARGLAHVASLPPKGRGAKRG